MVAFAQKQTAPSSVPTPQSPSRTSRDSPAVVIDYGHVNIIVFIQQGFNHCRVTVGAGNHQSRPSVLDQISIPMTKKTTKDNQFPRGRTSLETGVAYLILSVGIQLPVKEELRTIHSTCRTSSVERRSALAREEAEDDVRGVGLTMDTTGAAC